MRELQQRSCSMQHQQGNCGSAGLCGWSEGLVPGVVACGWYSLAA